MNQLRRFLHLQLVVGAHPDGRLTLTNKLLVLIILLAVSVAALSTEPAMPARWHDLFPIFELIFGVIFLVEYVARIYAAAEEPGDDPAWRKRWHFVRSRMGLIDLMVVISTLLLPLVTADATMLRTLRLMRVLAVMKFGRFGHAFKEVWTAIAKRADDVMVTVALTGVTLLFGATALYITEGAIQPEQFGSIPRAMWWSVITLTTVGYGDAAPVTVLGKVFASIVALAGIALVAMPTGIIAAAFSEAMQRHRDQRIEEMRKHLERLEKVDKRVEAKLAELERSGHRGP